jgi:hypothetical protein
MVLIFDLFAFASAIAEAKSVASAVDTSVIADA